MNASHWRTRLQCLSAYGELIEHPLIVSLDCLLDHCDTISSEGIQEGDWGFAMFLREYAFIFRRLRELGYKGFGEFFWNHCRYEPTLYGKLLNQNNSDPALENAARREVDFFVSLSKLDCEEILNLLRPHLPPEDQSLLADLPRWSSFCPFDFDSLTAFHKEHGYGIFAQYTCFVWRDNKLTPVQQAEITPYSQLQGYELQRQQVYDNSKRLVAGQTAQNILLFGEGGTGKSAVVKSMVDAFPSLKLIQAEHNSLCSLPTLMAELRKRKEKFILFIDDLAFDQDDNTFSALKSILEGSLESPPENVVVYATSNRRHLVRQTFSERAGEEVDMMETISEKTALAERFGLRIPYMSMKKEEYLSLVDYLYEKTEPTHPLSKEKLYHKAMMWEIRHGGRTPRVAKQFIENI